jgi:hypothetical protein
MIASSPLKNKNKPMKKLNILLLTLSLSFLTSHLFAHALWIETAAKGIIGKEQTVKIYYGEFDEGERDNVTKWYSDIKDFKLWLVGPDQKKIELKTKPGVNYYEATFTPRHNGTYTLAVSHHAKELGGNSRYQFLSTTNVVVGKPVANNITAVNQLQIQNATLGLAQLNQPLQLRLTLNKLHASDKKVAVFTPNGWTKELTTDSKGMFSFVPPFPGRYVIEISDLEKVAGEHYGKPYLETWNTATYSIEVK